MSGTSIWTEYEFNISQPNGLAWPDGTAISVQKSARTDVQHSADPAATPPVSA